MSNKKLSRLLEPNLKFYFAVMLLFAVAAIPVNWQLALAEDGAAVRLLPAEQPETPPERFAVHRLCHRQRGHRQ